MNEILPEIDATVSFLKPKLPRDLAAAVVLGSGLGSFADRVEEAVCIPYAEIPGFTPSGVAGHDGALVAGKLGGKALVVLRGRVHLYEGLPVSRVVFPVRVLARLGVPVLVLTNAAGGIYRNLGPGDVMLITDHINLTGQNPLTGPNPDALGPRFPDLGAVYDRALGEIASTAALRAGVELSSGVYAAMTGPSYETPAEVRMLAGFGAAAVGMSTVPEAIAACHAGMRVLAFSLIANMAAGITEGPLTHEEVLASCDRAGSKLERILLGVIEKL
jgi:purine-nucleoside phosphorylase